MSLLVRKISIAKWHQREILDGESPSADAITGCMRTSSNTLSLWTIDSESDLEEAVIAIAAQSEKLETIDVTTIEMDALVSSGLQIEATIGNTPYATFAENHRDICGLDYKSLGTMSLLIIDSIRQQKNKRYTRSQLVKLIASAVRAEKVRLENLHEKMQKQIVRT